MKTLSKYIFKDIAQTQFTIFMVLMLIFMTQTFIRFISRVSKGAIPSDLVIELLTLAVPTMTNFMLPLSLFLAVLFSIGSLCSKSEMVVMKSVGYSRRHLLQVVGVIAFVTAGINASCTLYFAPWCEAKQLEIIDKAKSDPSFMTLESGRFITLYDTTLYIDEHESEEDTQTMRQLYIFNKGSKEHGVPPSVTIAEQGMITYDKKDLMWLILNNGINYESADKKGQHKISDFAEYRVLVPEVDETHRKLKVSAKSTEELLQSTASADLAELQWRVTQPISVFVLVFLVVPLSMVNPRQGRFAKFLPALAIYISFYLFAFGMKSGIARDHLPLMPGIFIVPAVYFCVLTVPLNLLDTEWVRKLQAKFKGKRS